MMAGAPGLLHAVAERAGTRSVSWDDIVVVRNVGPLATRTPLVGDCISNRGCNALLAARSAASGYTHFMKLRPAFDERFERECAVTVQMSEFVPAGIGTARVPPSTSFVSGDVRVLLQPSCAEGSLERQIVSRPERWADSAAQVLAACQPLLAHIAGSVATPAREPLSRRLKQDAGDLVRAGLTSAAGSRLIGLLEPLPEVSMAQHGDLWPRNVLLDVVDGARSMWIIDFESCGDVDIPLYDVFHLIRSTAEIAGGWRNDWLRRWSALDNRSAVTLAASVRLVSRQFSPAAMEASLVASLVDVAARLFRRGIAAQRLAGRLAELETIGDELAGGALRRALRIDG